MSQQSQTQRKPIAETRVSVVAPVCNEAPVLRELHQRLLDVLEGIGSRREIIFVNDGSHDESPQILDELAADPHVRVLHLSRNFGHQAAIQAGLAHAGGDAVVVMDADLQDDPAGIPLLIEKWREGYDVVYAIRHERKEGPLKRFLFFAFYRLLRMVSHVPIPLDAGSFGLVDRAVADEISRLADRDRYYPGLRRWVGFRQIGVRVERLARYDARPRVSIRGLFRLARAAIFSFSSFPLTIFFAIAFLSFLLFLIASCFTLYHRLFTGRAIPGWTSIIITASFFGALNALGIGLLGEYIVRIYDQVRGRPMFIVKRKVNFPEERQESSDSSHNERNSPEVQS